MPAFTFTSPEGKSYTVNGPEGSTKEQAFEILQKQIGSQAKPTQKAEKYDPTEGMGFGELALAGVGKSFYDTARGVGQIARAALPEKTANYLGLPTTQDVAEARARDESLMSTAGGMTGNIAGQIGQAVAGGGVLGVAGKGVAAIAPRVGQAMQYAGGGLVNPASVKQAATGAALFAGSQPVTSDESRVAHMAGAGAAGAAGAALVGKIAQKIGSKFGSRPSIQPGQAEDHANEAITQALSETGQSISDLPPAYIGSLRNQVSQSLMQGKKLDPAAMLRKADFDALNMQGTLGQITRDPMQYARERNLRGVEGVGEKITQRLTGQEDTLRKGVSGLAKGSTEFQIAGQNLADSLAAIDDRMRQQVSAAYKTARQSGEAGAEVNLTGLAQDYARISHEFGDKLPSGVRNVLNDYGLMKGKQTKLMTIDDAEKVLNVINNNVGSDKATNTALSEIRNAVKRAVTETAEDGGPYAAARKLAADRFALHDAIPALAKSAQGEANADTFVKNYLVSGKTSEVNKLANLMRTEAPESFDLARSQIGDYLQTAAYGANPAGDSPFHAAAFSKALKNLGTSKLSAFFSPEEIAQIKTIGRVGAYVHSIPNAAAVSTSNSQVPVVNTLLGMAASKIPGANALASIAGGAKTAIQRDALARAALAGQVPAEYIPRQFSQNALNQARMIGGLGGLSAYQLAQ